jgi:NAD(P)-dependent dehydrogenase (short-subunit alcohol dehydrogenase family)
VGVTRASIAIVTGGASGIGLALSRALVQRGAHVIVVDDDADRLTAVPDALEDVGPGSAEPVHLDVVDAQGVRALIERVHRQHGRLDQLFNNAGIGVGGEPEELDLAHWDRVIDVNLRGVLHGCHAAYRLMCAQGSGHIVNTASLLGLVAPNGQAAPYAMSKHGVVGLSLGLRAAASAHGVQVHVVCPGVIDTPLLDSPHVTGLTTPPSVEGVDRREAFARMGFKRPYPPDRLADDVLRGVDRGDAVIVAPRQARVMWRLARYAPRLALQAAVTNTDKVRSLYRAPVG